MGEGSDRDKKSEDRKIDQELLRWRPTVYLCKEQPPPSSKLRRPKPDAAAFCIPQAMIYSVAPSIPSLPPLPSPPDHTIHECNIISLGP